LLLLPILAIASLRGDLGGTSRSVVASRPSTSSRAWLFLSPNTDENLSSDEAVRRLHSLEQRTFRRLAAEFADQAGLRDSTVSDALGDWSDGMENSLLVDLPRTPDMTTLEYAAALFGLRARQKSVLVFRAEASGQDELSVLDVPERDLDVLRRTLDERRIPFRTIAPTPGGHRVVIVDAGRQWHDGIGALAGDFGVRVEFISGRSVSVGAETRADARSCFLRVIADFERRTKRTASFLPTTRAA
jgi:hypothetical protein